MAKVTGIGGVFFKSRGDHAALAVWYEKHLGMTPEPWGGVILTSGLRTRPMMGDSLSGASPSPTPSGSRPATPPS